MSTKRMTKAERHYRSLLAEAEASGKTLKAFSAERGLPPNRLSWWKHKLKWRAADAGGEAGAPTLVAVQVTEDTPAQSDTAVSCDRYELVLRCGWVIRASFELEPAKVASLARALEASC